MVAATGVVPYHADTITAPGFDGFAIVPSDSVNFNIMCRGIYVGGTGAVSLVTSAGTVLTFSAVPVGTILPIIAQRVNSTLTTATLLVGIT